MLGRARFFLEPTIRNHHTHARPDRRYVVLSGRIAATAVVAGSILWYSVTKEVHSDAHPLYGKQQKFAFSPLNELAGHEHLRTVVWGSNRSCLLSPESPSQGICNPTTMKWLDNVALRDLAFHKNYAACVDARGDVYQWGEKVTSLQNQMPRLAMKGKDIKEIRLTDNKLYALSTTGRVYALSLVSSEEGLHQSDSTSASNSWWGASWFGGKGESIEFIEVIPKQKLSWGERITSIVAGDNHLLAVTSKGRTFAHPINKHANSCGQLGIRKVEVHNDLRDGKQESLVVDLTPRSLVDPFVMAALANRRGRPSEESDKAPKLNDKSIHSCPYLFEIPALQGVFVEQVAAGRRSSFARTSTGRVLAWGANEYGQLGLGKEIPFETVTVPTEVILWRFTPATMQTKCLDVSAGGDLTSFTVERSKGSQASSVDLLMCGNGQWGGLGNNTYSTAQGTPVKAKSVSGRVL